MSNNSQGKKVWRAQIATRHYTLTLYSAVMLSVLIVTLVSACRPAFLDPPRLGTSTAGDMALLSPSPTPVISDAPTPTAQLPVSGEGAISAESDIASDSITLWVNETSEAHAAALEKIATDFTSEQRIRVEVLMVSPRLLPELVQQAIISDTLPDLIVHPVTYSEGWTEQGILDPSLASEAVQAIGESTFEVEALNTVRLDNGLLAAIPNDGWRQLLIYRADWFSDLDLEPPEDYDSLMLAAETIFEPEGAITGIVVPTDASLVTTQQVFEYLAIANNCELVESGGRVALLHPACLEALEFYRQLINGFSPIGFQTDISALNAYLAGRTGMIITSPAALPYLAGLVEQNKPSCPNCFESDYLVRNSGVITHFGGGEQNETLSSFSEMSALGITSSADRDNAMAFAKYWFNEGYSDWLAVNPERKVPLRTGTQEEPGLFIDNLGNSPLAPGGPTLLTALGPDLVKKLTEDIAASDRWGFAEGQGELLSIVYQDLLLSPLLQDMLSGYFSSSQSIIEMYQVVVNAIPGYNFPIEIVPTPTQ